MNTLFAKLIGLFAALIRTSGSAACLLCLVPLVATGAPQDEPTAATSAATHESKAAEKAGLSVVIQAAKGTFTTTEPLTLNVTFRNVSTNVFRLPDQVKPAKFNFWSLKLEDTTTGKTYIAVTTLPMGAAPEPGQIKPVPIKPDETVATTVTFRSFGYVAGAMSPQEAKRTLFQNQVTARDANPGNPPTPPRRRGRGNPVEYPPPPGTYKVSVDVGFNSFPDYANVPDRIRAAKAAIENDPIPLWPAKEIQSDTVVIKIEAPAPGPSHGAM